MSNKQENYLMSNLPGRAVGHICNIGFSDFGFRDQFDFNRRVFLMPLVIFSWQIEKKLIPQSSITYFPSFSNERLNVQYFNFFRGNG